MLKTVNKRRVIVTNLNFVDSAELHKLVVQQVVVTPYPAIIKLIEEQAAVGTHDLVMIVDELLPVSEEKILG